MDIVNGILDIEYILFNVFPGDYGDFYLGDGEECNPCDTTHVIGDPFEQWNYDPMREEKLNHAREERVYHNIERQGVKRLLDIEVFYDHTVLLNGHHRLYSAWELGFERVPVSVCYSTRRYELIPDKYFTVLGYWENRYSMA